jgi:hypothetical protein
MTQGSGCADKSAVQKIGYLILVVMSSRNARDMSSFLHQVFGEERSLTAAKQLALHL